MTNYRPTIVRVYGRAQVEITKGAKSIFLDAFSSNEEARDYAQRVAQAIGCECADDLMAGEEAFVIDEIES